MVSFNSPLTNKILDILAEDDDMYFLQPDGTWKKDGDGRSPGKTYDEVTKMGAIISEADDHEPDTKAEVDLDDITGTDKSQQIQPPPEQPEQPAQAAQRPKQEPAAPPNLDEKKPDLAVGADDGNNILSSLKGHPYVKLYTNNKSSGLDPVKMVDMDKTELVALQAKIDDLLTQTELRKRIGLYKDNKYQILVNLKDFIGNVLERK